MAELKGNGSGGDILQRLFGRFKGRGSGQSVKQLEKGDSIEISLADGTAYAG
jgi:hypothetical protein